MAKIIFIVTIMNITIKPFTTFMNSMSHLIAQLTFKNISFLATSFALSTSVSLSPRIFVLTS